MTTGDRPLAVLTDDSEHRLEVLRRGIKRAAGFVFYVLVARDLGRVELLRRLRVWSGVGGFPELHFFPEGEEGARALDRFLAARDEEHAPAGVVILDGAALLDADDVIATLNVSRDVLYKVIRGPLLLVVPPEREGDLAGKAADLFDVRAGTVAVEGRPAEVGPILLATIAEDLLGPERPLTELQLEAARLRALGESEDPPHGALADAWARLGEMFLNHGETGEARQAAQLAQRLAERAGYPIGQATGALLEGRVLDQGGRLDEARALYESALTISTNMGNLVGMAWAEYLMGQVARERGELDEATRWHLQALTINKRLNLAAGILATLFELGHVAILRGELDSARAWCEEALDVSGKFGAPPGADGAYYLLGVVAQMKGELDQARAWYEMSLDIKRQFGDVDGVALQRAMLGGVAEQQGHPEEALDWTIRAVSLPLKRNREPDLTSIARLTATLGLPTLEATWQRVTGAPLPPHVRAFVEEHVPPSQPG